MIFKISCRTDILCTVFDYSLKGERGGLVIWNSFRNSTSHYTKLEASVESTVIIIRDLRMAPLKINWQVSKRRFKNRSDPRNIQNNQCTNEL